MILFLGPSRASDGDDPYLLQREFFREGPSCIQFSPDGKLLLTGFTDGSFRVLDPQTMEVILEVEGAHDKPVMAMDMPPKMDFILTAGGNMIKLWNRDGKHIGNLSGHSTTIWDAEINSKGNYAVSSAYNKTFLLWDVYNGVVAEYMRGHEDITPAVTFSRDGRLIASGSNDHTLRIWDLETREVVHTLNGPTQDILDVAFSPDGNLLAAASTERSVRVYDVQEEKLVYLLKGHQGPVRKLAFALNGRYLASASEDHSLILWDVKNGDRIHTYTDNRDMLTDVVFHPDGASVYTISRAGYLTRWALDPEIFVIKYYGTPYQEELDNEPLLLPRQSGESRKDYQERMEEAGKKKREIIDRYYRMYLDERDKGNVPVPAQ